MRLYYEDGTVYEGAPGGSPVWGLVAIAQPEARPKFKATLADGPYFLFREDWACWMECDLAGLLDQLSHHAHLIGCVRVGRYIRADTFKATWKLALSHADAEVD